MAEAGRDQEGDDRQVIDAYATKPEAGNKMTIAGFFGTVVPMALAVGLLGAFGGCSVDLSFGLRESTGWYLLAGLIVGLVGGIALGASDHRHAGRVGMRRLTFARPILFGMAWLAIAASFFRMTTSPYSVRDMRPVFLPIRLDKAGSLQASFVAKFTSTYNVQLDLKKTIPFEDLVSFMGGSEGSYDVRKRSANAPPRPKIEWSVSGVNPEEQMQHWKDVYYSGDSVGLGLGRFEAVQGRSYTITVTVQKPSPRIQVTDPHFQVHIAGAHRFNQHPRAILAAMACMISGFIAACLLLAGLVRCVRDLRSHRMPLTPTGTA